MKLFNKPTLKTATAAIAILITQTAHAIPTNITDNYIGAADNTYGDVISSQSNYNIFNITSMDVERVGNFLSVALILALLAKAMKSSLVV